MNNSFFNKSRRTLIRLGKMLPFIICSIVLIGYTESLIALIREDYLIQDGCVSLNTPISFWIAKKVMYDWIVITVVTIISFAIQTCYWNKLAIIYLALQLMVKYYTEQVILEQEQVYIIIAINILLSGFFTFKGLYLLFKNKL